MLTLIAQAADFGTDLVPKEGYGKNLTPTADSVGLTIENIISNVLGTLTVIGAILFIIYFLWGSVDWITSGGDSGKVTSARNKMVQGAIGLIVLVLAYGLIGLIGTIVGVDVLHLNEQLKSINIF